MAKRRLRMALLLILGLCIASVAAHNITQLEVPMYADPRRPAELSCRYKMDAVPPLHSVKWYRDSNEIFRYTPGLQPPTRHFDVSGLQVSGGACDNEACTISILPPKDAPPRAAYTCEVSTERPKFAVVRQTKHMTVAALPADDPLITGVPPHSALLGEELLLNCTSDYSLPPAEIVWYIDDEIEKPEAWQPSRTEISGEDADGLRASWRALRLRVSPHAAARGHVSIRCEATLKLQPAHTRSRSLRLPVARTPHISKFTANGSGRAATGSIVLTLVFWTIRAFFKASAFSECPRTM